MTRLRLVAELVLSCSFPRYDDRGLVVVVVVLVVVVVVVVVTVVVGTA